MHRHVRRRPVQDRGVQQGNRLTRRPCKGHKVEIEICDAKGQNAGICGAGPKMFATSTFMSIGGRVTQVTKSAFARAVNRFVYDGKQKIWHLCFSIILCKHPPIHFFFLFDFAMPKCPRQRHGHRLQQGKLGDILTPCPAVRPRAPLVCTRRDDAKSYEVLCFSRQIMLANLKI